MLDQFLDWLAGLPTLGQYSILMALSALENVFPPVPADVAVGLGAFLAQRGAASALWIGVACWAANTASAVGVYALARARGEVFFRSGWPRRLLPPETLELIGRAYRRHGMLGIFLSRFLPGFRAGVLPFAGVVGLSPLRALGPAALASAIWYALIVTAGALLGLSWERLRALLEQTNRGLGLISAVLLLVMLVWLGRQRRRHRRPGSS
jgi:membrane protein DedA with SNARE-associated domain